VDAIHLLAPGQAIGRQVQLPAAHPRHAPGRAQQLLAVAQPLLRPPALGDVLHRHDHAPLALQLDQLEVEDAEGKFSRGTPEWRFEVAHPAAPL